MGFGFAGDFLSFLGGFILSLDAIFEERKLRAIKDWEDTIAAPELAKVVMTRNGIKLKKKDDVELSFVRQSTKKAIWGAAILTLGFACLFFSRLLEAMHPPHEALKLDNGTASVRQSECRKDGGAPWKSSSG